MKKLIILILLAGANFIFGFGQDAGPAIGDIEPDRAWLEAMNVEDMPVIGKISKRVEMREMDIVVGEVPNPLAGLREINVLPLSEKNDLVVEIGGNGLENLEFINIDGDVMEVKVEKLPSGDVELDLNELKSGVYFLTIQVGGEAVEYNFRIDLQEKG